MVWCERVVSISQGSGRRKEGRKANINETIYFSLLIIEDEIVFVLTNKRQSDGKR